MAGAQDSFGKVAERLLYKLTGLRLCESTVERTTEAAGKRLGELLETGTILAGNSAVVADRHPRQRRRRREQRAIGPGVGSLELAPRRHGNALRLCEHRRHRDHDARAQRREGRWPDGVFGDGLQSAAADERRHHAVRGRPLPGRPDDAGQTGRPIAASGRSGRNERRRTVDCPERRGEWIRAVFRRVFPAPRRSWTSGTRWNI